MGGVDGFLDLLKKDGIEWLELHFTDIVGRLRMTSVPVTGLSRDSLREGIPN
jgi:glutamine synthetase